MLPQLFMQLCSWNLIISYYWTPRCFIYSLPLPPLGLAGIDSHPAYLLLCRPISRLLSLPAITSSLYQGHLKPNFSVYHLTTDCQHSVSGAGRFCKMALCKFSVYLVYFTDFYLAPRCYWEIWAIFAVSKVVIVEIFSIWCCICRVLEPVFYVISHSLQSISPCTPTWRNLLPTRTVTITCQRCSSRLLLQVCTTVYKLDLDRWLYFFHELWSGGCATVRWPKKWCGKRLLDLTETDVETDCWTWRFS